VGASLDHIEAVARRNNPRAAIAVGEASRFGAAATLAKVATMAACPPDVGGDFSPLASSKATADLDAAVAVRNRVEGSPHLQAA